MSSFFLYLSRIFIGVRLRLENRWTVSSQIALMRTWLLGDFSWNMTRDERKLSQSEDEQTRKLFVCYMIYRVTVRNSSSDNKYAIRSLNFSLRKECGNSCEVFTISQYLSKLSKWAMEENCISAVSEVNNFLFRIKFPSHTNTVEILVAIKWKRFTWMCWWGDENECFEKLRSNQQKVFPFRSQFSPNQHFKNFLTNITNLRIDLTLFIHLSLSPSLPHSLYESPFCRNLVKSKNLWKLKTKYPGKVFPFFSSWNEVENSLSYTRTHTNQCRFWLQKLELSVSKVMA